MEVIGNIKYVTGVTEYVVDNNDGTINVDTSVNAVTIILPNILGSGYYGTAKGFIINDISDNASVNNIIIVAADNTINSTSSVSITQNGGTAKCSIANQNEWFIVREPEISGGVSEADNGLNVNINTVELGGTLIKDTVIDVDTFGFNIKKGANQSLGVTDNGSVISEKAYVTTSELGNVPMLMSIDNTGLIGNSGRTLGFLDTIWLANGNSFGSEKYFGTNDNYSIPIYTNNVARGIIGNNGDFAFGSSTLLANTRMYVKGFDSTSSNNALVVANSSGNIAVFRNDGNVGIGTSTPTALLQIEKATSGYLLNLKNLDATLITRFKLTNNSEDTTYSVNVYGNSSASPNRISISTGHGKDLDYDLGSSPAGTFRIARGDGYTTPIFFVNGVNSNVGIGTSTPTSKLQVVGLPTYIDNAAALGGGLTIGAFYHTAGVLKVVI